MRGGEKSPGGILLSALLSAETNTNREGMVTVDSVVGSTTKRFGISCQPPSCQPPPPRSHGGSSMRQHGTPAHTYRSSPGGHVHSEGGL